MPRAPDVTLVTCDSYPDLSVSDRILSSALQELGLSVQVMSWSDPLFDWSSTRLAVLRSAWDSHLRPTDFRAWLSKVAHLTSLCNKHDVVRWNFDKHYLMDLSAAGVSGIPSIYVAANSTVVIEPGDIPWRSAVVKPAIGASSHQVRRFDVSRELAELNDHLDALRATGALLQRFEPNVETLFERSLVFIDGEFTHAVRRTPFNRGDTPDTAEFDHFPSLDEIAFAVGVLRAANALEVPFARVDLLPVLDHWVLMELELIDPSLFFTRNPAAAKLLASRLCEKLAQRTLEKPDGLK